LNSLKTVKLKVKTESDIVEHFSGFSKQKTVIASDAAPDPGKNFDATPAPHDIVAPAAPAPISLHICRKPTFFQKHKSKHKGGNFTKADNFVL
jgi:hypothetical protein